MAFHAALLLDVFELQDGDLDVPGTSVRGSILSFVDFSKVNLRAKSINQQPLLVKLRGFASCD